MFLIYLLLSIVDNIMNIPGDTKVRVNGKQYRTIWPVPEHPENIAVIDQRTLPYTFETQTLSSVEDAHYAIREMVVRGAGLIGAAAGYGMHLAAVTATDTDFFDKLVSAGTYLKTARPTARDLAWAVDRILDLIDPADQPETARQTIFKEACRIADDNVSCCEAIGRHGLKLIEDVWIEKQKKPVNILTHCNAGWLAFVDIGSATAPIYAARDAGIDIHVWVDETRPWNQGSRLTAWELQQEGIANTLITDNAGGHLMQNGEVDLVIVGTDRTTHTGDVANKIGTYLKALAAHDNDIPFYVALPSSTFDWTLDRGGDIPIEKRSGDEITTITGVTKSDTIEKVALVAPETQAVNYSFDVTPARLVTSLITERGIVKAERSAIHSMFPEQASSVPVG